MLSAGRAGRGNVTAESIVLYTPDERKKVKKIRKETHTMFNAVEPPTATEHQDVASGCLFQALLQVGDEYYAPHFARAARLLKTYGAPALASALTLLYGAEYGLTGEADDKGAHGQQAAQQLRSLLTGRKDYVALVLYDPTHSRLKTLDEAAQFIRHALPSDAPSPALGRIMRSSRGYVADVAVAYAARLASMIPSSRKRRKSQGVAARVPIYPLEELPELLQSDQAMQRLRRRRSWLRRNVRRSAKTKVPGTPSRCPRRTSGWVPRLR